MARSKQSQRWLKEHREDPYVIQAQRAGYRSRAAFKLMELQQKDQLFKRGMTVIDLGAAPGGWSQLLMEWVGKEGRVIAVDVLPMDPIDHVAVFQSDFTEPATITKLRELLADSLADIVVSDMSPNLSGITAVDQPRAMGLVECAFAFAAQSLKPQGAFVAKVFQGSDFTSFVQTLQRNFATVQIRKPKASRDRSREVYVVAKGFKRG